MANPSPKQNIIGARLTQLELERLDIGLAAYADQAMREVARRLLGQLPGAEQLEILPDPRNRAQAVAWSQTTKYLAGRIQARPEEKPGRTPDMSVKAAKAMRAVLKEVGGAVQSDSFKKRGGYS